MPRIIKPCQYCNKEFTSQSWKGYERKYCSSSCKQKYMVENNRDKVFGGKLPDKKRMDNCRECGKEFWKRHVDKYFCNPNCYLTWKRKNAESECIICNNKYYKRGHSQKHILKLCSTECREKYWKENGIVIKGQENSDYGYQYKRRNKFKKSFPNICEKCNSESTVEIHHLNGNPKYNPKDGENWMMLCKKCHLWIHREGRKQGHYLTKEDALKIPYSDYIRIRKSRILDVP